MTILALWPLASIIALGLFAIGAARTRHHASHHLSKRHSAKTVGVDTLNHGRKNHAR